MISRWKAWNARTTQVIFPPWVDRLARVVVACLLLFGGYVTVLFAFGASPLTTDVGYAPEQPVAYSHLVHAGQLGLDCRYCHTSLEDTPRANVPPTQTCINCHAKGLTDSPLLEPVRRSYRTGMPIPWVRVHDLPDYVFFDHSAHVRRGIGCESCHGRVDAMDVVAQVQPLSMAWCIDCHRHPERELRPPELATVMGWQPPLGEGEDRSDYGRRLMQERGISPPTDCSTCHR